MGEQIQKGSQVSPDFALSAREFPWRSLIAVVVERDPYVRRLIESYLREAGYSVEFVDDGYVALDTIRLRTPTILLTEILIPRLDGLALTRILKGEEATKKLPIIVLSPLDAEKSAREAGADAFIKKPIEKTRVLTVVRSMSEQVQNDHER